MPTDQSCGSIMCVVVSKRMTDSEFYFIHSFNNATVKRSYVIELLAFTPKQRRHAYDQDVPRFSRLTPTPPPPLSGFQVTRAYQATRQLPPPPTGLPDTSHSPPQKPSSDAPSLTPRPAGPEQPWCTNTSPGRQTATPPLTGQTPSS